MALSRKMTFENMQASTGRIPCYHADELLRGARVLSCLILDLL